MRMGREGGDWCKSCAWLGVELMSRPGSSFLGVRPGKCDSSINILQ